MAYSIQEIETIFEKICSRVENGESVRTILKEENMPSSQTFFKWLANDTSKSKQYAYSCEVRAEAIFEEMLDIADDGANDLMTITKGDLSYEVENKEVTNRSRLRIDTRKWILSKLNPKKFSDKADINLNGQLKLGVQFDSEYID